jgi:hypothetical protein
MSLHNYYVYLKFQLVGLIIYSRKSDFTLSGKHKTSGMIVFEL